jgi:hypothetical protein
MKEDRYISQSAAALGVTPSYLRLLEREGKIPKARRDEFGRRVYDAFDIRILKSLGVGCHPARLSTPEEVLAGMR